MRWWWVCYWELEAWVSIEGLGLAWAWGHGWSELGEAEREVWRAGHGEAMLSGLLRSTTAQLRSDRDDHRGMRCFCCLTGMATSPGPSESSSIWVTSRWGWESGPEVLHAGWRWSHQGLELGGRRCFHFQWSWWYSQSAIIALVYELIEYIELLSCPVCYEWV